jgi:hypothetical protein
MTTQFCATRRTLNHFFSFRRVLGLSCIANLDGNPLIFAIPVIIKLFDSEPTVTGTFSYQVMRRQECIEHIPDLIKRYQRPDSDGRNPKDVRVFCQCFNKFDLDLLSQQLILLQGLKP